MDLSRYDDFARRLLVASHVGDINDDSDNRKKAGSNQAYIDQGKVSGYNSTSVGSSSSEKLFTEYLPLRSAVLLFVETWVSQFAEDFLECSHAHSVTLSATRTVNVSAAPISLMGTPAEAPTRCDGLRSGDGDDDVNDDCDDPPADALDELIAFIWSVMGAPEVALYGVQPSMPFPPPKKRNNSSSDIQFFGEYSSTERSPNIHRTPQNSRCTLDIPLELGRQPFATHFPCLLRLMETVEVRVVYVCV